MELAFPIILTFRASEGALRERANQRFLSIFVSIFLPLMVFLAHDRVFDKDPDIILDNVVVDTMIQNQVSNVVKPIKKIKLCACIKTFIKGLTLWPRRLTKWRLWSTSFSIQRRNEAIKLPHGVWTTCFHRPLRPLQT